MASLGVFTQELERRVGESEQHRRAEAGALAEAMREREDAQLAFERTAELVHRAVIRPRLEALAARFVGASVDHVATPNGLYAECALPPSERFPAAATVQLGITGTRDGSAGLLSFAAEITPAFMEYERARCTDVPLRDTPWDDVAAWVEGVLLGFVDAYLRIERHPLYQRDNIYIDPVCGMPVPGAAALERHEHDGRTYHFCAASCRERFAANPELFLRGAVRLAEPGPRRPDGHTSSAPSTRPDHRGWEDRA